MAEWIDACAAADIDTEGLRRFDHGGRTFAIFRSPEDAYFCTDGLCSHQDEHLSGGIVKGHEVQCPGIGGTFDYRTGLARRAPARDNLQTYPVKVEDGRVLIGL